jgi:protein TonB
MNRPIASHGGTNGASRGPMAYAVAFDDDPMSKVLGLDDETSGIRAWFGFTSGSTLLMAALMALTSLVGWIHAMQEREAPSVPQEIDIMKDETPPPPPPTAEPEAKQEPAPPPPVRMRDVPPPAPAPAQAAKVIAQEPTPDEPIDLTGNTIVQGNADSYAGGFTSGNGTNANAVRALPSPSGVPGGTGPVRPNAVPAGPDRSRQVSAGNTDWNCPFPPESDTDQIDEARVTIQVDVRADGTASAVRVVTDPGNGFGREARRCALGMHYLSALDHDGNPIPGSKTITVRFHR